MNIDTWLWEREYTCGFILSNLSAVLGLKIVNNIVIKSKHLKALKERLCVLVCHFVQALGWHVVWA